MVIGSRAISKSYSIVFFITCLILASGLLGPSVQAGEALSPRTGKIVYNIESYAALSWTHPDRYQATPEEACRAVDGPTYDYHIDPKDETAPQGGYGFTVLCWDQNWSLRGYATLRAYCSKGVDPYNPVAGETITQNLLECEPSTSDCDTGKKYGNPIDAATGIKSGRYADFRSPIDGRFSLKRAYFSDDNPFGVSPDLASLSDAWRGVWDSHVIVSGSGTGKTYLFENWDFCRYRFDYTGQPQESGHAYSLSIDGATGDLLITAGTGMSLEFSENAVLGKAELSRVSYSDGYEVSYEYDPVDDALTAFADNKGQKALVSHGTPFVGSSQNVILKIEIDTGYSGTFDADAYLEYFYVQQSGNFPAALESVDLVDAVDPLNEIRKQIWKYEYLSTPSEYVEQPPGGSIRKSLVRRVYDGTEDALGNPVPIAEYEYSQNGGRAVSTSGNAGTNNYSISWNLNGTPASVTNSLGRKTIDTFIEIEGQPRLAASNGIESIDGSGNPTPVSAASTSITYDYTPNTGAPEGYVYSRLERNGTTTKFERNARGLIITKTEDFGGPDERTITYTWHSTLRLPATRSTARMKETFSYDTDGLLTSYSQEDLVAYLDGPGSSITNPNFGDIRTWTYTYIANGNGLKVLDEVDGPGVAPGVIDVTSYTYDSVSGQIATVTDPNGLTTTINTRDTFGNPKRITQPNGVVWEFAYDVRGRLKSTTRDPDGAALETSYSYTPAGDLETVTDSALNAWTYTYDAARRLEKIESPMGDTMHYTLDAMGNITQTRYFEAGQDPLVDTSHYQLAQSFDELGRLMDSLGGANLAPWEFDYDLEDNPTVTTDPTLETFTNLYDKLNRITGTTDESGGQIDLVLNEAGQTEAHTDQNLNDTNFYYNGFGDLIEETSPDRGTWSYAYNDRGLVETVTDGNGVTSTYTYDDAGRILSRSFPDTTENQLYTYDQLDGQGSTTSVGQLTNVDDESGYTRTHYTDAGLIDWRVSAIKDDTSALHNYSVGYWYDDRDLVSRIVYPSSRQVQPVYNADGEITALLTRGYDATAGYQTWLPLAAYITYKPFGPIASLDLLDGYTQIHEYDQSYRLTGMSDTKAGAPTLRDRDYGYTDRDEISSILDNIQSGQSESYTYGDRGYLDTASGAYGSIDYGVTATGARESRTFGAGGDPDSHIAAYAPGTNRIATLTDGTSAVQTYSYDGVGNVIRVGSTTAGALDTWDLFYNDANRMERIEFEGTVRGEYLYNYLGQQVRRIRHDVAPAQTIHTVFDAEGNRLAEYDVTSGTPVLLREYVWLEGRPFAVIENDGSTYGSVYLVRTDHIGRPVFSTGLSGAVVWRSEYLPFGEITFVSGTAEPKQVFPGQWFQGESGLHQNWMRDYDPVTGSYLQPDPLGLVDGPAVYAYAKGAPGVYTDPRGEQGDYGTNRLPFTSPTRLPFDYHPRTAINHPFDPYHQFPQNFDPHIWWEGYSCIPGKKEGETRSLKSSGPDLDWGYFECRCLDGALNGVQGRYEVGVRVPFVFENPFGIFNAPQPTVVHRNFRPNESLR